MWPEVTIAKNENRRELVLSDTPEIRERITRHGLDKSIFSLTNLNLLSITSVILSELPDDITNLTNLQSLILHSNKLTKIPDGLGKLTSLKLLDLSGNQLESVPDFITNLAQIVTFNFSNNKLENFPALSTNAKLTVIDLSNNQLKVFPDICKESLTNLSEIKLRGNKIEELPNTISNLPALKVLDVSENSIKILPGELADCSKLKEVNLKSNPIADRRLFKLIDQCRTKQVLDYVKQNCAKTKNDSPSDKKSQKNKSHKNSENSQESNIDYKYTITVKHATDDCKVIIQNSIKNIREHIICCVVNNVSFTAENFKKFIQIQNKFHDTVCEKRNIATIATHDFVKLGSGNLTYTTAEPTKLMIKPLNRATEMSGAELFAKLQLEANNLRKEKKRNTYSGIHKYLYLIEGKPLYPCLLNVKQEVVSFPPITNSEISKIEVSTTRIFIEVTSTVSHHICKQILDDLLKEMTLLFQSDLEVLQIKIVDAEEKLKNVYPSKTDLIFEKNLPIKVVRE